MLSVFHQLIFSFYRYVYIAMLHSSIIDRRLLPLQFFSPARFQPKNKYVVRHNDFLNGLACFPKGAFLQKNPCPLDGDAAAWKSKLLVVKDANVYGTYQPPPLHPFPQSFAPEGISIDDYRNYVATHDSPVFVFIVSRIKLFCGLMRKDATWAMETFERPIERSMKEAKLRTMRNSKIYVDAREFMQSNESIIDNCATFWYRVSGEHAILLPDSHTNKRIRAEQRFGAARWHEEDEHILDCIPFGGDSRWISLPQCPWPVLLHRDSIARFMDTGVVEVA